MLQPKPHERQGLTILLGEQPPSLQVFALEGRTSATDKAIRCPRFVFVTETCSLAIFAIAVLEHSKHRNVHRTKIKTF